MNEERADTLPWSLADRLVQARVEAHVLGEVEHPVTLGRYRIERGLGAGAMGRLLLAFDPDLQRQVALKLISAERSHAPGARQRIIAEARAMAQLSDPHVAQVYEVDEVDGQIVLAIEYVDGVDLRAWLDESARHWSEVITVFREAGAGLAAAHDKGITHRDFKPENVMLHRDGRARVVDFGLAHAGGRVPERASAAGTSTVASLGGLTRTGASVGTPAYMAPEQWDGGVVDARSDQYAFCVALFEALAGARPFEGDSEHELRAAQRDRLRRSWPGRAPRWLEGPVRRGLQHDPALRWPDMRALLRALDPGRRRRRWAWLGTAATVSTSIGLALWARTDPCAAADAPVRAVWNDAQRAAVSSAVADSDPSWGPATVAPLVARLDAHAQAWGSAARALCAVQLAGDSDTVATAGCIEDSRRRLSEGVAEAIEGDPALLVSAVARAELLPDPRACADAPSLLAYAAVPDDPGATTERIAAVQRSVGSMSVRVGGRGYAEALALGHTAAEAAIAAAEELGHEPLLARALWVAGRLYLGEGDPKRAERTLRRGLTHAGQAADAPLAAAIQSELVYAVARDRERFREAEELADQAGAAIASMGSPPLLDARLRAHRASAIAHAHEGDHDAAVVLHEQAVAIVVATLGPHHPDAIGAVGNLGAALNYAGRPAEAQARLLTAIDAAGVAWGEDHPRTALLLGTLGLARMRQGDVEGAEQDLRRSLQIREASLGSDHAQVDDARYNLASALSRRQQHAEAQRLLDQGLEHTLARLGPDDARLGPWWVAAGESALALGQHARAREALTASLRIFERTGASARDYARVRLALAQAWADLDVARARTLAEHALADAIEADATTRQSEIQTFLATLAAP